MSKTAYAIITALVAIIVIGGALLFSSRTQPTQSTDLPAGEGNATSTPNEGQEAAETSKVKVALLDYTGEMDGKQRGCDIVVLAERTVPATTAPLTAALKALFATKADEGGGLSSFMPKTAATLTFDRATVASGVASIYLEGSLTGLAGVCDDPRAKIQIEETALQFPTVQTVKLYLNGVETDLQPNEKGE